MASATSAAKFFMRFLGGNLRPRVPRTYRDVPEPQAPQQFADTPFVQVQRERFGDLCLQINPPPAHHPVLFQGRAGSNPIGHLFLLRDR